jgi:quercetin dioxygenase-like cupin family protein
MRNFAGFGTLICLCVGAIVLSVPTNAAGQAAATSETRVIQRAQARHDGGPWGRIHVYFEGDSAGTKNRFAGAVSLLPGQEIHPAHKHAEEEYLMITKGTGTWQLGDRKFAASEGDMLYAAPWDLHGLRNTSRSVLTFVVIKFDPVALP